MEMKKKTNVLAVIFLIAILATACKNDNKASVEFIPKQPDYTSADMWYEVKNDVDGSGIDVFYVPSTWEFDWTSSDGTVCHYADVYNPKHTANMAIEMKKISDYMADQNNFYSPYYRHITLNTWATLNEDTIASRYSKVSWLDVKAAFDEFLKTKNKNRPFILAGFSQGGKSVVELLKTLDSETYSRMVAAYVIGYKVEPKDMEESSNIKPATCADDTGVTICYNSVSDVKHIKPIVSAPTVMCINPVNWTIDGTPAKLGGNITVTMDTEYFVLVVDGYDGSQLPNILDILNVGDYHGAEPWLYSECLRENIKTRKEAYFNTVKH